MEEKHKKQNEINLITDMHGIKHNHLSRDAGLRQKYCGTLKK
jgi:hypothetical protein